mgnify:FL=1|tara:strand:- start:3 stop:353 length:351 start_codon:yes stop_codon:yes gene_type:complete
MELVFVYGTLRKGHGNHVLLKNSEFVDAGLTKKKYAMYANGIPFVSDDEEVSSIFGELYKVSSHTLRMIDLLEGHPSWYERKKITVIGGKKRYKAWLYFNNAKEGHLVESGDYERR